jgi:PAS domain S-box-containing protein
MINDLTKPSFEIEHIDSLKPFFEQIFNPIVITTSQLELPGPQIVYANQAFCKQTGYKIDELLGNTPRILQGEKTDRKVLEILKQKLQNGEFFQENTINYRKDGSEYWVEWNISALYNKKEQLTHYFCVQHDISVYKELEIYKQALEKELEKSTNSLREYEDAIINNSAIAKLSTDLKIKYLNNKYLELLKYTKEEMIGKPITQFVAKESLKDIDQIVQIIQNGQTYTNNFQGKPKYGDPFYTETTIKPIKDTSGKIVEYLLIKHDITPLINTHNEITATQKEIVYKMGEIGESRSQETGNHVQRVAKYSKLLGTLVGLSDEEIDILFIASPMHDIGKVAIADNILNKPGKLTSEEFEKMKEHSSIGYEVLKGSNKYILQAAAVIAHQHHEKWDGTGYPNGLKGEQIHIYGRISAIADVFDALGSDRCYKSAWELEKILELFQKERGKHFDPQLIDLFMENLEKFLDIRDEFQD